MIVGGPIRYEADLETTAKKCLEIMLCDQKSKRQRKKNLRDQVETWRELKSDKGQEKNCSFKPWISQLRASEQVPC